MDQSHPDQRPQGKLGMAARPVPVRLAYSQHGDCGTGRISRPSTAGTGAIHPKGPNSLLPKPGLDLTRANPCAARKSRQSFTHALLNGAAKRTLHYV